MLIIVIPRSNIDWAIQNLVSKKDAWRYNTRAFGEQSVMMVNDLAFRLNHFTEIHFLFKIFQFQKISVKMRQKFSAVHWDTMEQR